MSSNSLDLILHLLEFNIMLLAFLPLFLISLDWFGLFLDDQSGLGFESPSENISSFAILTLSLRSALRFFFLGVYRFSLLLFFGSALFQTLHHLAEIGILPLALVLLLVQLDRQAIVHLHWSCSLASDLFVSLFLLGQFLLLLLLSLELALSIAVGREGVKIVLEVGSEWREGYRMFCRQDLSKNISRSRHKAYNIYRNAHQPAQGPRTTCPPFAFPPPARGTAQAHSQWQVRPP